MNIKPLGNRVLLEPVSAEEKTESGIILPDTVSKEKPEQGRVKAIGDGKEIRLLDIKIGDVVLFTKYGPNEIKIGDKEYLIAKEEDILGVVE